MGVPFEIIATGSTGNAVVLNDFILIDCGVSYKALEPYIRKLKLVLLTHIHGDHFRESTIRKLAENRPRLRFAGCRWMARPLVRAGVKPENIDVLECDGTAYAYGVCNVVPVLLHHDVPNCGYKIEFPSDYKKVFYATDTGNLNGISAKNYDLYMIEANYGEQEIRERIAAKKEAGEFVYERRALEYHLSREACDDFIYRNIGPNGEYVYLHEHVERGCPNDRQDH